MFKRRKHRVPTLNTTSTADISFMLLIFFLVTTSMDIDKGLSRQLPPLEDDKEEQVIDMNKNDMIRLSISADNQLSINDRVVTLQQVRQQVMDFVEHCPDRQQHVVSVEVAREATYDTYFNMQNEIVAAYNTLREQRAQQIYHLSLAQCTEEQRDSLRAYYPQRIAETYLKGGAE
ncbi:MAG: biopolymer transporter ExbD [Prevotella sp.]|nr:biopolymer transporter ExbD [Prevotella sp.]